MFKHNVLRVAAIAVFFVAALAGTAIADEPIPFAKVAGFEVYSVARNSEPALTQLETVILAIAESALPGQSLDGFRAEVRRQITQGTSVDEPGWESGGELIPYLTLNP